MDLLNHIYINKSFYTLKVRFWFPKEIPSQTYINKEECCNITGRIAKRDNNGNITVTKTMYHMRTLDEQASDS